MYQPTAQVKMVLSCSLAIPLVLLRDTCGDLRVFASYVPFHSLQNVKSLLPFGMDCSVSSHCLLLSSGQVRVKH